MAFLKPDNLVKIQTLLFMNCVTLDIYLSLHFPIYEMGPIMSNSLDCYEIILDEKPLGRWHLTKDH